MFLTCKASLALRVGIKTTACEAGEKGQLGATASVGQGLSSDGTWRLSALPGLPRELLQVVPFQRRTSEVHAICSRDSRSKSSDQHFIHSKVVRVDFHEQQGGSLDSLENGGLSIERSSIVQAMHNVSPCGESLFRQKGLTLVGQRHFGSNCSPKRQRGNELRNNPSLRLRAAKTLGFRQKWRCPIRFDF